jgi:hypothetical protein
VIPNQVPQRWWATRRTDRRIAINPVRFIPDRLINRSNGAKTHHGRNRPLDKSSNFFVNFLFTLIPLSL